MIAISLALLIGLIHSTKQFLSFSELPMCGTKLFISNSKNMTEKEKQTHVSPLGSFMSFLHSTKLNNVQAPIKETHKRTYERQKCCIANQGVICGALNLKNGENSAAT